jgi:nucleoside-diphosphate-sugar epimerase
MVDENYRYDGPHLSEYDRTKWVAHYEVAEPMIAAGLPLVIVMPGLVYGPGDTSSLRTTLIQYLQRKLPMIPKQSAFSWAHVDDIARGHILAMEKGKVGESYIIAGPTSTLEDALALAELLRSEDTVEAALERYAARRRPRAQWVQEQSRVAARAWVLPPAVRNAALRERGDQMLRDRYRPLIVAP